MFKLSWTHYRILLQVHDDTARRWYEKEAYEQTWSVRTLQRNIDTQYYYRLLQSQDKKAVESEMKEKSLLISSEDSLFFKKSIFICFYCF